MLKFEIFRSDDGYETSRKLYLKTDVSLEIDNLNKVYFIWIMQKSVLKMSQSLTIFLKCISLILNHWYKLIK